MAFDTKPTYSSSRFVAPSSVRQRARRRRATRRRQNVRSRLAQVRERITAAAAFATHNLREYTGIALQRPTLPRLRRPRINGALDDVMVSPRALSARLRGIRVFATPWHSSKLVSVMLLAWTGVGMWWIHSDEMWFVYREDVSFAQNEFINANELYSLSGMEGWNLLWQQPQRAAAWIAEHPYIASAEVSIRPPLTWSGARQPSVQVLVNEVEPSALWVTDGGLLWLLADGAALPAPRGVDVPTDLLRIIDGPQEARALDGSRAIEPTVLASARALVEQMPSLGQGDVRYSQKTGLNFVLPEGMLPEQQVVVYWGDGDHAEEKLRNLRAVRELIEQQGDTAYLIDVRYLNRPYYR